MKKLIFILIFICTMAHASITLTSPSTILVAGTSITTESAPNLTCYRTTWDGPTNTVTARYYFGTVTKSGTKDTAFVIAPGFPIIVSILNLATGINTISMNGTVLATIQLTPTQVTGALSVYTGPIAALQNAADAWLLSNGIVQGTQSDTW